MVLVSVDRGRAGLLLAGFVTLFAGEVGVSIVVAQTRPVLVTLATDWEERRYEGGEERMETSVWSTAMAASSQITLPSPLRAAPRTPCACPKFFQPTSVKGDRRAAPQPQVPRQASFPLCCQQPFLRVWANACWVSAAHTALILSAKITNKIAHKIKWNASYDVCAAECTAMGTGLRRKDIIFFTTYLWEKRAGCVWLVRLAWGFFCFKKDFCKRIVNKSICRFLVKTRRWKSSMVSCYKNM